MLKSIAGLPLSSMSLVPIYAPDQVSRETKWSKAPCLRKQRNGRGLKHRPPDPVLEVLTAQPHTPPLFFHTPQKYSSVNCSDVVTQAPQK